MGQSLERRGFLRLAGGALVVGGLAPRPEQAAVPRPGLVLGHPQAAEAGMAVLAGGGNAVDAAVAAALVAGVVAVPSCGIGGYGGHMVIAYPNGHKVVSIDFNTTAPAAASPEHYAMRGWRSVGVPGTLAGLQLALDRHGTRSFARLVQPALHYARAGFVVSPQFARALRGAAPRLLRDPGSARLFFRKGKPLPAGAVFRNPGLADLLEQLATYGSVEPFYRGPIARRLAAAFAANGGLVTTADLAAYRAEEVAPLALDWRGHTIHTAPLTAGGLTVLQALATLKALDPFAGAHARLAALQIAWADRLRLLGDPRHAALPVERLLSERYAEQSAVRVRSALAARRPIVAAPDGGRADGTIHLTAVSATGMMVALTLTHGDGFGAEVTADGLGLVLGHGISRFHPRSGHPNSVGPGKRPLHNMCPTIVCRSGKPMLALGAVGGRRIPNTVFDVLAYRIGEGRALTEAVAAPRMHTEGDERVALEAHWPPDVAKDLKEIGYVVRQGAGASLNAIERWPEDAELRSAAR